MHVLAPKTNIKVCDSGYVHTKLECYGDGLVVDRLSKINIYEIWNHGQDCIVIETSDDELAAHLLLTASFILIDMPGERYYELSGMINDSFISKRKFTEEAQ